MKFFQNGQLPTPLNPPKGVKQDARRLAHELSLVESALAGRLRILRGYHADPGKFTRWCASELQIGPDTVARLIGNDL